MCQFLRLDELHFFNVRPEKGFFEKFEKHFQSPRGLEGLHPNQLRNLLTGVDSFSEAAEQDWIKNSHITATKLVIA